MKRRKWWRSLLALTAPEVSTTDQQSIWKAHGIMMVSMVTYYLWPLRPAGHPRGERELTPHLQLRDLCCCHCDATDTHRTLIVKGPGYNAIACFTVFRPNQTFVLGTFSKTWSQKGKGEVKLATYFPLQTNWVMWLDHWFDLCPWCFLFLCFFVVCKWDQSMRIWSWTWIWIWSDPDIFHSLF